MSPSHSRHSSELLPGLLDELVLEILLRIPPDRPECLVRASLVSKAWRRALSGPAFCRRYRDFHRTPPMLGFFFSDPSYSGSSYRGFVPTTSFRAPITAPTPSSTFERVVNACHGRVLFRDLHPLYMVVWDPITGDQRRVFFPWPLCLSSATDYAVLCATAGCDHRGCQGGPFFVVRVCRESTTAFQARVYSSGDGAWGDTTSVEHPDAASLSTVNHTSVLLGNTVCMSWGTIITGYNMDDRQLSLIDVPSAHYDRQSSILMTAEDGTLGFAGVQESKLLLWSRKAGPDGAVAWTRDRVIDLESLLPIRYRLEHLFCGLPTVTGVVGFADGVVFISTEVGLFTIQLSSDRVQKVSRRGYCKCPIIPYTSFYTLDHATRRLPPP